MSGIDGPVGFQRQDGGDGFGNRSAGERAASGEQLEQHAPERPDVGPLVGRLSARLLRTHVGRRADDAARHRDPGEIRRIFPGFRQTEVEDLDHAGRRDLDVRGLQVAMDDPALVRGVETVGNLPRDAGRGRRSGPIGAAARDVLLEGFPFDQFQDQRAHPGAVGAHGVFDPVDGADVGMIERGEHPGLALEAGQPLRIAHEERRQDLDRHVAPEPGVVGAVDLAHPAFAEQRPDLIRPNTVDHPNSTPNIPDPVESGGGRAS